MQLTLGPILGNWPADRFADFYARIADEADIDRVVIGEVVCSKRLPFFADRIAPAAERLAAAGKQVVFASLGLVTLPRERRQARDATELGGPVEINDLTMLRYLAPGQPFTVGPLVNVYNEGTLGFLAARGALSVCLPPELPLASIATLARAAPSTGADIEVWGFGRVPLAISGRCYHARIHGLAKDSCQFVCAQDPDGLEVDTLDGEPFLAANGVQTLSFTCADALGAVDALAAAGVARLRLSPQSCDMVAVARIFRDRCAGRIDPADATTRLSALLPSMPLSNGFMLGPVGAAHVA